MVGVGVGRWKEMERNVFNCERIANLFQEAQKQDDEGRLCSRKKKGR